MRATRLILLLLFATVSSARALSSVHVIQNGNTDDLRLAIQNAADGDTILLHGGTYSVIQVQAKSLTIVAEPVLSASITDLTVISLSSGQLCVLAGLDVRGVDQSALSMWNCDGSVRAEDCRIHGDANAGESGVTASNCSDVAFVRCTLEGGSEHTSGGIQDYPLPAGLAVSAATSRIAIYDSTLVGGAGAWHFGTGAPALRVYAQSTVFLARCTLTGGAGSPGRPPCTWLPGYPFPACGTPAAAGGDGGPGAEVSAPSDVQILDCLLTGGAQGIGGSGGLCCGVPFGPAPDGQPGPPSVGISSILSGASPVMTASDLVRENSTLSLAVSGAPGDIAVLAFGSSTHWSFAPGLSGVILYGTPFRRVPLGVIPQSGTLQISLPLAMLPAGIEAQQKFLQVAVRTGSGPFRLGSPHWLTVLDASF